MSFDQLSSHERQPTTMRRDQDPEYQDDPEFDRFAEQLSVKLFSLTSNISRLSQQIALLGTKRDTERVRERVHNLLGEARDTFKEVGEGIKRLNAWEDLNVRSLSLSWRLCSRCTNHQIGFAEVHPSKDRTRVSSFRHRIPNHTATGIRKAASISIRDKDCH
jgi:hypothetical protein